MTDALTVHVDDRRVLAALASLEAAAAQPEEALDEIGAVITENVRLGFDQAEDPYGRPWKPVRREGGHPLRDTGMLMNSWTYRVQGDHVAIGSNRTVTYDGRSHNLADIHQHGRTIRPVKARALRFQLNGAWWTAQQTVIPPRPMLPEAGWPDEWAAEVLAIVDDYLAQAAGRDQ